MLMIFIKRLRKLFFELLSETILVKLWFSIVYLFKFRNSYIHFTARVQNSKLGNFSAVHRDATLLNSRVGDITYIGPASFVSNADVGDYCSIAPGVVIGIATHRNSNNSVSYEPNIVRGLNNGEYGPLFKDAYHYMQNKQSFKRQKLKLDGWSNKVTLGNNVYIGQNTLIAEGITVGNNVIIGCNSFVNKDVISNSVVAGNPARDISVC